MNGVAVAPHRLVLSQRGATASQNLFECLPGPPEAIFDRQLIKIIKDTHKHINHVLDV